jgi:hypothetical protein
MQSETFPSMSDVLAVICVLVWLYLIVGRGAFWLGRVRDTGRELPELQQWPAVVAVIPARNESDTIVASVTSLLRQEYSGSFSIVVVDDDSSDGTGAAATHAAEAVSHRQLTVVNSKGPPAGWTGKLWALKQGIAAAELLQPDYLLLTDADIVHAPDTLAWLVKQSSAGRFVLTSLMAKLRCVSLAERSHVPAFIYFFQMLFPFSWVCRPNSNVAGAAGGCMFIRADALARAGGVASIRNALLLAATTASMVLTFILPPLLAIFATGLPRSLGIAAWLAMALSFVPTLQFYRQSLLWSLALPGIALLYLYYTLNSAYQYMRGRGGQWKGRAHADAPSLQ